MTSRPRRVVLGRLSAAILAGQKKIAATAAASGGAVTVKLIITALQAWRAWLENALPRNSPPVTSRPLAAIFSDASRLRRSVESVYNVARRPPNVPLDGCVVLISAPVIGPCAAG